VWIAAVLVLSFPGLEPDEAPGVPIGDGRFWCEWSAERPTLCGIGTVPVEVVNRHEPSTPGRPLVSMKSKFDTDWGYLVSALLQ
jgi:hypothetical protein